MNRFLARALAQAALLAISLWCALGATASAQIVVRKEVMKTNPGILVAAFDGPGDMRDLFVRALAQSDWFTVVKDPAAATYTVSAAFAAGPTLTLQVRDASGAALTLRQTTRSARHGWVVYQAVDSLIGKLFDRPGLCASTIAFANGARGYKEVFACNFDGTNARQLTHNRSISTEPSWGPRAGYLVYTLYSQSATDVVLADLVNRRQRRLSQFPGLNAGADLSPDGQWAAVCLSRDRQVELYLLRLADKALVRLTQDKAVESSPCWSPDGSTLCYVSDKAGRPNLYLIAARAGATPQRLVSTAAECVSPAWSRSTNQICFATRAYGDYDLAVVDMAEGSREMRQVTRGGGRWEAPSWAPDGRHVVCTNQGGSRRELCMVDTWTGRTLRITTAGDYSLPSWSELHD